MTSTPGGRGGRPEPGDHRLCQQGPRGLQGSPIIIGGIQASLLRLAYYDYWEVQVRHSVLFDAKAIRLSTLEELCRVLRCQPGDLLEYEED